MTTRIISITPIRHIQGVVEQLESIGELTIFDDPSLSDLIEVVHDYEVIFTNPNKSKIYLDEKVFKHSPNLKVLCTASTGTNHINKNHLQNYSIDLLSLTEERSVIDKISSTAEHALALTMSAIRNIPSSFQTVLQGEWNYEDHIGRQIDQLTIGVIGYGRLGKKYTNYISAMGAKVLVFDPYQEVNKAGIEKVETLEKLFQLSDVISIHVHVTDETVSMINKKLLDKAKKDVLLINTSRGEIINEADLVNFLYSNPNAKAAVDVISDEIIGKEKSPLLNYSLDSSQVIITPHIGGMTQEAQQIAYNHAAEMLRYYYNEINF